MKRGRACLPGVCRWAAATGLVLAAAVATPQGAASPAVRSGPPAWAADTVWYHVAVDRFRNGDPRNDPRASDLRGASGAEPGRDWQIAPWTASWYGSLPWERATGRDFYSFVPTRRYGGDLQGVIERLDHLTGLGVNGLILQPVFEAPSAAKRDPSSLHHVDNNFGPDPEGDRLVWATENPVDTGTWKWSSADRLFLRLVQECRRRQVRVVVEMPLHAVGSTFWAYRDARARGAASKFAGWFASPRPDDARGGDEVAFKREGDGLAAGPRDHLRAVLRRWADPNGDGDPTDGVDGFLFTDAEKAPLAFLRETRRLLIGGNPEILVAGGFGTDDEARTRPKDPTPFLTRDAVDAAVDHAFGAAARAFFLDRTTPPTPAAFDSLLARIRGLTRPETAAALLLPIDGPDGERAASRAVNPDREAGLSGSPRDNPGYDVRAPRGDETKRLRLLAVFQFAALGAPLVTYGTETGLWGAAEPDNLRPMLWRELKYEDDSGHPAGNPRKSDPVRLDDETLKLYQALGRARAAQPALRRGTFETLVAEEDGRRLYAFARVAGEDDRVVAAFNLTEKEQTLDLPFPADALRDLLSGRKLRAREGRFALTLPALSSALVVADTPR